MAKNIEKEQYESVCEPAFKRIDDGLWEIKESLGGIKKALYVGNGKPSLMVRLDRMERVVNIICWLTGAWVLAAIAAFVNMLFELFKNKQ